ncbi:unnamed protein product [Calypogeia fissa]
MANCLAICAYSTGLAGSTVWNSSALHVSPRGGRNALLGAPVQVGLTNKHWEGTRQRTRLARGVTGTRTRAGLGDAPDNQESSQQSTSEDWQYLAKLMAGCTAGAVLIKYGSILLPQIHTQPNLVIALLLITTPVVASVVVLAAASSKSSGS